MLCSVCERSLRAAFQGAIEGHPPFDFQTGRLLSTSYKDDEIPWGKMDRKYVLQESPEGVFNGYQTGCVVCRSLWTHESLQASFNDVSTSTVSADSFPISISVDFYLRSPPNVNVYVRTEMRPFLHFTLSSGSAQYSRDVHRSLATKPGQNPTCTSGAVGLWRYWYRTCRESHGWCKMAHDRLLPFKPSRLIEILDPENAETTDLRWRLVIRTKTPCVPYVTLSHCWGVSQHALLTRANFSTLLNNISNCSTLPKTYQDALTIAQSLGFRYIWIDSLCIIQDDRSDWLFESSRMDKVYNNSSCNIAATWASDGNGGCFSERDPALIGLAAITIPGPNGEPMEYQLADSDARRKEIEDAPLNSRGWVFQERYLSPRQVQFAASQVYWECLELIASEQFPAGLPEDETNTKPTLERLTLPIGYQQRTKVSWFFIVKEYSGKKVTRPSDRTVALSALVGSLRSYSEDEYLAGLWRKDLSRQLLWTTTEQCPLEPRTALAPSWSWLSVNTPVDYDARYVWQVYMPHLEDFGLAKAAGLQFVECVEIKNATVRSEHWSKLHSFTSSELVVQGVGLWGRDAGDGEGRRFGVKGASRKYRFMEERGRSPVDCSTPLPSTGVSTLSCSSHSGPDADRSFPALVGHETKTGVHNNSPPQSLQREIFHRGDTGILHIVWDTSSSVTPESRTSTDFLFLIVAIRWNPKTRKVSEVEGLVLEGVEGAQGNYTREGVFLDVTTSECMPLRNLAMHVWERTMDEDRGLQRLTFGDPEIAKLLQTVTIV